MFKSKPKHSLVDLFEGAIIGSSLAVAATFLFGTKKGKELQKRMSHHYKKLGRTTKEIKKRIKHAMKNNSFTKMKAALKAKMNKAARKMTPKVRTKKVRTTKRRTHRKAA